MCIWKNVLSKIYLEKTHNNKFFFEKNWKIKEFCWSSVRLYRNFVDKSVNKSFIRQNFYPLLKNNWATWTTQLQFVQNLEVHHLQLPHVAHQSQQRNHHTWLRSFNQHKCSVVHKSIDIVTNSESNHHTWLLSVNKYK